MASPVIEKRPHFWECRYLDMIAQSPSENRIRAWAMFIELGEQGVSGEECLSQSREKFPYGPQDKVLVQYRVGLPLNKKSAEPTVAQPEYQPESTAAAYGVCDRCGSDFIVSAKMPSKLCARCQR